MKARFPSMSLLLAGVAVVALAIVPALAQPGPMGYGHGMHSGPGDPEMMFEHMAEMLELTDQQRDEARQILDGYREEIDANRSAVGAAHELLADLMHAETFDEAAIRATAEDLSAAQTEIIVSHALIMRDLRQVLTPEQLEKFQQARQSHGKAMGKRGRGHGHGHGKNKHYGHDGDPSGE